jgi:hypothetical protein
MRHQDQNFNTRLTKMRKDIEEIKSLCWRSNLSYCKKPDESLSSHLTVGGVTSQVLGSTVSEIEPGKNACHWAPAEKGSPLSTRKPSVQQASLDKRLVSESSLPIAFPSLFPIRTLTRKRASDGSVSVSPKNVPSLSPLNMNSKEQRRSSQRRGSLGSWILKKLQIS